MGANRNSMTAKSTQWNTRVLLVALLSFWRASRVAGGFAAGGLFFNYCIGNDLGPESRSAGDGEAVEYRRGR